MTAVHLVCDSTADLEPAFRGAHTVRVVPLKVIFGEETFSDGVDITAEAFYARLARPGPFPRTSQPTPAEFEAVFRELGSDGGAIVCTTISSDLSGTYASATQARAAVPELDVRVIDTRSVAVGHYAVVREAVRVIEAGGDADAVVAAITAVQTTARVLFTVETLEFLRRGGRIGGARALLGSMLDIKPVLEIRGGAIEPVARVRTYPKAIDRVVEEFSRAATAWGGAELIVAHADRPETGGDARRADALAGNRNTGPHRRWSGDRLPQRAGRHRGRLLQTARLALSCRRALATEDRLLYCCLMTVDKGISEPSSAIEFRLDPTSGVPTHLQLVHQVEHAMRLGYLKLGDQLPKVRDVVASLAINPNTVLKAYRELEIKGLAAGRPGQGTFIQTTLSQATFPELTRLRRLLLDWLTIADAAGLDEDGIDALFTSTIRTFRGLRDDARVTVRETEGIA